MNELLIICVVVLVFTVAGLVQEVRELRGRERAALRQVEALGRDRWKLQGDLVRERIDARQIRWMREYGL